MLDETFKTLDPAVWTHEVQTDGFGTGSFDWTTASDKNTVLGPHGLQIIPTLTNETAGISTAQVLDGYTLNLTTDGTCTSTDYLSCSVKSNSSFGTIIPPVQSARLNTKGKKSIKYGKVLSHLSLPSDSPSADDIQVEVVAKMPKGDWIWPAIW